MADPLSVTASITAVLQLSSTVLRYLVDVKDASADRKSLIREISSTRGILSTLNETVDDARVSDETWSATIRSLGDPDGPLIVLKTTLTQLATTLKGSASATGIKKAANSLRWPFKQSEVKKILSIIERQKSTLSLALENDHIALSREIRNNTEAIRDDVAGLSREFAAARLDAKTDAESLKQNVILNQLPYADGAPFNAFRRDYERYCLPDTRVELLNEITTWGNTSDGPCIFWLNGMAGTGKSTISRTVARHFAEQRRLGASFFFSRGQGDLGHAEKFFTTIASQIAHALPTLKRHICEAIAEDHRIGTQGLREQWRKLIFQPLSKLENLSSHRLPIILVIDALDECEKEDRKDDVRMILRLLAEAKDLPNIRLRIFLTSRPEVPIDDEFNVISKLTHQDFILHHISNDIIEHDILIFIQYEFERIRRERGLLSDWPKAKDIHSLVHDANGLFIYAATICRFIDRRHPEKQLSIILQCMGSSPPTLRTSPTRSLDEMYSQVLKSSIYTNYDEEEQEELVDLFKLTVGSIVILSDTLSTTALTNLLNLPRRDVDETLKHVQAVLDVPSTPDLPVRLLHPSFRDFLLDKNRCSDLQFWVDEKQAHQKLADDCIRLMSNSLKQDVCRQEAPGTLVADIEGSRIEQCLPLEVRYACLYWIQHLQKSGTQLHDNDHVYHFLQVHLLHWLEALSWVRKISDGILAITSLESIALTSECPKLYALIYDIKRFVLYSRPAIEHAPLQIYCSALAFAPAKSIIRKIFQSQIPKWIVRLPQVQKDWSAAIQTLDGHTSEVSTVVFSPDGKQVASGSGDDTVRLWDTATGTALQTLEGHTSYILDVAFSPDGKQVASASSDGTVRLWDAATGAALQKLEVHTYAVCAVAFSPDSKKVASGSSDKIVRLWDAVTGDALLILEGHTETVNVVAFSPNGEQVASGSRDKTVRLWDAATGAAFQTLEGHTARIGAIAFWPDGKQVASSSGDNIVRLWDAATGVALQTFEKFEGYTGGVGEVTFSPDGKQVASGSWDDTVQLWDAATGAVLQTLEGHTNCVNAVAFSPDGKQVASGSDDWTVRLWDTATGATLQTPEGHTNVVGAIAFGLDGKQVASGSDDSAVRLWDAETSEALQMPEGHTDKVTAVAFSPDDKQVASGSRDGTVMLWDTATGAALLILEGHTDTVDAIAFSPDGKQVASGSSDTTVRLWDAITGDELLILEGHIDTVDAVAFSPDGKEVASGSGDTTVQLWDAVTGDTLLILEPHTGSVDAVAFSPDGKQVASGSWGKTVRLWDAITGDALLIHESHIRAADAVAFSTDSKQAASASSDDKVQLWDAATGAVLQKLAAYTSGIGKMAFSLDGKQVAYSLWGDTVRLWDVITGDALLTAKGFDPAGTSHISGLRIRDEWITRRKVNLLWLPHEYRTTAIAVSRDIIVLGHQLGSVSILEFKF